MNQNNNKFVRCPIVVKRDDGTTLKIIELSMTPYDEFVILDILNAKNQKLGTYTFDGSQVSFLIKIPRSERKIKIQYRSVTGKLIKEEEHDVFYSTKLEDMLSPRELRFERAVKEVKEKMQTLEGATPMEASSHSKILNESIVLPSARQYVYSQVRKIIVGLDYVHEHEVDDFVYLIYARLYGMDILQDLDDDPEVGEIMVNATEFPEFHCDIYYIKHQKKYKYEKTFTDVEVLKAVLRRVIAFQNKEMNESDNAIIETTRPNRDRVNLIIPKASDNYCLNIRKFSNFVPNLAMMFSSGTVNKTIDKLLAVLVHGHANVGIGGPMGTGKTTFINFMLTYTAPLERKVVIAAVNETDVDRVLKGHDVSVFNVNEDLGFTFSQLVRTSLRTTADRVIIPESRGGEFKQLYEANLKTKGNFFTAHAIDDVSFMDMCVDMYMSSEEAGDADPEFIRNKICKAIDIIIMMRRVGNKIRIKSISEVVTNEKNEYAGMNQLIVWDFDPEYPLEGAYMPTGNKISDALMKRLNEAGVSGKELAEVNDMLVREHEEYVEAKKAKAQVVKTEA